jgi:hypothetical protein
VEFDETNGSQEEDENLDDVRGTQLFNAMKNMDIGDIRPREVIDVKDDKNQVLSNLNVQASGSHDQDQARASDDKVQDQQQVASSSSQPSDQLNASNQVQVLQPTNVARDYPLDSIISDISRGVQTRSKLASFCEYFLFV